MSEPRTALITGANRGLGHATAAELRRRGLRVIVTARDGDAAAEAAARIGPDVRAHPLDVTDPDAAGRAAARLGAVDVLVCNAGVLLDAGDDPLAVPLDVVERTLAVNLLGGWRVAQAFVPGMVKRGWGGGWSSSPAAPGRSARGCGRGRRRTRCRRPRSTG
ncbi:SDR family oxidoreductase [Nonomuraea salmonea]|uniref:SDR family NAD(P)-dependent oxidoreductase n=1 Tax=Nonomuraea salmonea TaxID=46181 RepID=UPI002FE907A6